MLAIPPWYKLFDWNGLGCAAMGMLLMSLVFIQPITNYKERIEALETELTI